ncbi:hypothetical protein LMG29542_02433 [Paraburkholderia humisilvae]|uniref:Uncharacterized protein n=1 Tax=Paraburkholderia humisilvae TaxID=627669 RepID=A0A6J5DMG7_9BURK|nr:hypothetical protein LMG29542_02433 [Paraburkholderia humisilvae]
MLYSNSSPEVPTSLSSHAKAPLPTNKSSASPARKAARSESPNTLRNGLAPIRPQLVPALAAQPVQHLPLPQRNVDHSAPFKARGFSVLRESSTAVGLIKHVRSQGHIVYAIDLTFSLNENATTILAEGAYCLAYEDDMRFITRTFPFGTPVQDIERYFAREYDPNAHVPLA